MRSQKKETQAFRRAWALAVAEGRVVRFPIPEEGADQTLAPFKSYPSIEARDRALDEAEAAGVLAIIVVDRAPR
jgi:hypothetical protein